MRHPSGYSKEKPNLEYVSVAIGVGVGVGVCVELGVGVGMGVGVGVGVVGEGAQALTKRMAASTTPKIVTPTCFCFATLFFIISPPHLSSGKSKRAPTTAIKQRFY
jgi:hypothetical protein